MNTLQKFVNTRELHVSKLTLVACGLLVLGILLRIMPHTANFAPVGAIALFAGAVLSKRMAIILPLSLMIVSDLIIGLHSDILFTWGGFALVGIYGMLLRHRNPALQVAVGAVGSALIFFVVSNFGVWLSGDMYARTWQGFVECYTMALPFLRPTFLGDLAYAMIFFNAYVLAANTLRGDIKLQVHSRAKTQGLEVRM